VSGFPDPKPVRTARKQIRVVDRDASTRILLRYSSCAACGAPAANAHHVVQKGSPHFGDDVEENLLPICGSGTTRCHGAIHGSPYVVEIDTLGAVNPPSERRDAAWVSVRLGAAIRKSRPDVTEYVLGKLGHDAGLEFLRRFYYFTP